jgi:cellulose synthase/poly-beta-1,6-N-acetylglucosamine synthase-like glycosyltransferase
LTFKFDLLLAKTALSFLCCLLVYRLHSGFYRWFFISWLPVYFRGSPLVLCLTVFWDGFIQWLSSLTLLDFFLIFWPLILIDFVRSLGKSLVVSFTVLYNKLCPKPLANQAFFPKLSLIIPAHNEEQIIVQSIEAALEADYPDKEIIVVDDGSTDQTLQLASSYAKRGLIKLVHNDVASGSKTGALNFGLLFTSGEVIVPIDADTLIERSALKKIVAALTLPNVSAVSGNVRVLNGEHGSKNLLVKLQEYEYLVSLEFGRRFNSLTGTMMIISGAFGAFWRKLVESTGGYDKDTLTEDFDLTIKMRKITGRIVFAPKAVSWTIVPSTWGEWQSQRIRWTRGQAETLWKHRNVLQKIRFDFRLVLMTYDMLFMDLVAVFARFIWLFLVAFFYQPSLLYVLFFGVLLYLAIELISALTAAALSSRKSDLKMVYLVPVMVLFYRPYYSVVRFVAYLNWVLKRKSNW